MIKENEESFFIWRFAKLIDFVIYVRWKKNIILALKNVKLWSVVCDRRIKSVVIEDATEKEKKKNQENIIKWKKNDERVFFKIVVMCDQTMRETLDSKKSSTMNWNNLKTRCTSKRWIDKWEIVSRLHHTKLSNCKNVNDFETKMKEISSRFNELEIDVDQMLVLSALHNLKFKFDIWIVMLSKSTREDKKLFTLIKLFDDLRIEKTRIDHIDSIATIDFVNVVKENKNQYQRENQKDRENHFNSREEKDCDHSHDSKVDDRQNRQKRRYRMLRADWLLEN